MISRRFMFYRFFLVVLLGLILVHCGDDKSSSSGGLATGDTTDALIADHDIVNDFDLIPAEVVEQAAAELDIYYAHTSHGSQILTGLEMIASDDTTYQLPAFHEVGDDLGYAGDTSWAPPARTHLGAHPECNVAMFSWCGGVSDQTEEGIGLYLETMSDLEADFPDVRFIYMTGHLDGDGPDGNLYIRNEQIRAFCQQHGKVLFDFADVESYDPDGQYYPDAGDDCGWCTEWCATHTCPDCDACAHSHCFNCYQKGKAFWWLMARLCGWQE